MAGIKELKTRIKSIGSTRKITRAMQMVSAAKMRKAQTAVFQSRNYASLAWEMIENVAHQGAFKHPLINPKTHPVIDENGVEIKEAPAPANKIGAVLLSSNKGLVGSLNTNLLTQLKKINSEHEVIAELITYGKKGHVMAARLKQNVLADFSKHDSTITTEDIYPLAQFISEQYATGHYKKIVIIYNHFVSTLQQRPTIKQLLPFSNNLVREIAGDEDKPEFADPIFIYEPDPKTIIDYLIPRIIESQIYQTILESDASEHSARMIMMKNATEAAGDLISDLTLTFNQLRQNKITTELAEITAGKIALE